MLSRYEPPHHQSLQDALGKSFNKILKRRLANQNWLLPPSWSDMEERDELTSIHILDEIWETELGDLDISMLCVRVRMAPGTGSVMVYAYPRSNHYSKLTELGVLYQEKYQSGDHMFSKRINEWLSHNGWPTALLPPVWSNDYTARNGSFAGFNLELEHSASLDYVTNCYRVAKQTYEEIKQHV